MQRKLSVATSLLLWLLALLPVLGADSTWEFSVQVSATVQTSPPQITLSWPQDTYMLPNTYTVYRKAPSDTSWGTGVTLPGTTTSFVDNNVAAGTAYEYQVVKTTSQYTGYGYIYAGIDLPLTEDRGKLLLVVDNTYAASLTNELAILQQDLAGDGWTVIRLDVGRNDSVTSVKHLIKAQYDADPTNVKAVFLFGHVPVPYSGDIVPDGHAPDHQGAWPCDGYYGDMDGTWTDTTVNDIGSEYARNHNVPGDGKFDQSTFPAPIKLMVGRVDLSNMPGRLTWNGPPSFPSELELLRNYLHKDHKFRQKQFDLPRRAYLADFFGVRGGEAFAASGWRNYATFFGATNLTNLPNMGTWVPTLRDNPVLCAYGAGAGSFTSIGGLGNADSYNDAVTTEVVTNDVKTVFALLFGSWLGDWDSEDNILRSILACPSYGLTSAWSGRPHWFIQHMALGEPIGYGARLTQNNGANGLYKNEVNSCAGQIHIALMGDPSLRLHIVAPPTNLTAFTNSASITLRWAASADSVLGYNVYRATNSRGPFTKLNTNALLAATTYSDAKPPVGATYMVRAVKLETSGSGTYYNASQGALITPTTGTTGGIVSTGTSTNSTTTNTPPIVSTNVSGTDIAWVDDALPAGARSGANGWDTWNWISGNPAPFSGRLAHQSVLHTGFHQHYFSAATATLAVNTGDVLYAYIYLDPANPPSEVMLQWNNGTWEHRAFWGANLIFNGKYGTAGRRYMGPLPAAGQWVRLEVPAAQVGLEGSKVSGMSFCLYNGRATWDDVGKASTMVNPPVVTTNTPPIVSTNSTPSTTNSTPVVSTNTTPPVVTTNSTPVAGTNTTPRTNPGALTALTNVPGVTVVDDVSLKMPPVGANALHVLAPNLLELILINTKQPAPATVSQWNLVNGSSQFMAPPTGAFAVTANGQSVAVTGVGFKRRPFYAPLAGYDLRIQNALYLQLAAPIADGQIVEVKNPDGTLWSATMKFIAQTDPLRLSPAVHVNQEGYLPNYSKKAMVGYYLGNLGEMNIPTSGGFKLVDANTGAQVYQGTMTQRPDSGYTYSPTPYQKVYEADFTSFNTPGHYRVVVPGLGGSLPFQINEGVGMAFARAYALGLYHQRCGTNTALPYTRFTHDICHGAPASVPLPSSSFPFTWTTVANYASQANSANPPQIAPILNSPSAQLFPYVRQGTIDVSGGHHDAGDYSKYTVNCASLIHYLMFAVDSLPGVAALDNLGIPESGDGISDVMQEAKWEADYLTKIQDSDGGFYFLVYPVNREYEGSVTPDHGDPQVVWPKTTSVTAASVAALAQCASSPTFKRAYPAAAALYLQKAQLGWQFLTSAIAKYGKNGAYQKITFYGDDWADNDEMAWAACQIFLATGDATAHQYLLNWFNPSDPATCRWGWWHMSQCWGHAIRSYAFAVQSGRVSSASALDATFLAKCQAQIAAAGDDVLNWSQQSAYGTSFPAATKAVQSAGWYFSCDQAFDITVAYQLNPKPAYINAIIANMNYEGGCNPVNVSYVEGLGWKRQREIVSQWGLNDRRMLAPSGLPVGNIQATFFYLWNYQSELENLCFPSDGAATPYPFYDRWGDAWNVSTEMVCLNSARALGTLAFLAGQTSLKTQPWKAVPATIKAPTTVVPVGSPVTLSLQASGLDLSTARIVWEARDQEPAFGPTFTYSPANSGTQWVEAEAQFPDGRRVFAQANYTANSPNVVWCDDAVPAGATAGADGGDAWTWVSSNPTPYSGTAAHQSAVAAGEHQHFFYGASATLTISAGDTLYAWVYLDPANPPSEIMLQWNSGTWEHRAYWGANNLGYGTDGTVSRQYMGALPTTGRWVQLKVPASQVGLEGSTINGMAFTVYNGRATWDAAGRLSTAVATTTPVPINSVQMTTSGALVTWDSIVNSLYRVSYKNNITDASWTLGSSSDILATNSITSWLDTTATTAPQRFYMVAQVN